MKKKLKEIMRKDINLIFYDLEFCKKYSHSGMCFEIIQIGAVKTNTSLNQIDSFEMLVRPGVNRIDKYCSRVTGLTMEDLREHKFFPNILKKFDQFVGKDDHVFLMWGSNDYAVLSDQIARYRLHVDNIKLDPDSHIDLQKLIVPCSFDALSLEKALSMYGFEPNNLNSHDALGDALGLLNLFQCYMNDSSVINKYYAQFTPNKVSSISNKVNRLTAPSKTFFNPLLKKELLEHVKNINQLADEGFFLTEPGVELLDEYDKMIKKLLSSNKFVQSVSTHKKSIR